MVRSTMSRRRQKTSQGVGGFSSGAPWRQSTRSPIGLPNGTELLVDADIQEFYLGAGEAGRRSLRDVKSYRRKKRWSA
jgi:hypothetical protein